MRILFMGTPDIAAESLNALIAAGHDICAVFTRADKPVGRKQILTAPPVKQTAEANGIPVYQPRTLRDGSSDELIKSLAPGIAGEEPDGTDGYHPAGKNFGKRYCGACRGWAQHLLLPF